MKTVNKKTFFILSIITIFLFTFSLLISTGCQSKEPKTTQEFKTLAENNNLQCSDITSQYASYGTINEGYTASSKDGWQVEFYVLNSPENTQGMFETNKENFEKEKTNESTNTSSSNSNYSTYTLVNDNYYMHLCRIDNTLLYARVKLQYKDAAESFISQLGY